MLVEIGNHWVDFENPMIEFRGDLFAMDWRLPRKRGGYDGRSREELMPEVIRDYFDFVGAMMFVPDLTAF